MKLPYVEGADREYYIQTGGIMIRTKVVGVTFDGRLSVIGSMPKHAHVTLAWDKENTHDDTAIGVYYNGKSIGYLKKELAVVLFPYVKNYKQDVTAEVTGGDAGNNYGVNLIIRFLPDSADPAPASEYIQTSEYVPKDNKSAKTTWIWIVVGLLFCSNWYVFSEGRKSYQDFIGYSIFYILWLIISMLFHRSKRNKGQYKRIIFDSLLSGFVIALVSALALVFIGYAVR